MSKERKLVSFDWAIKWILRHKANFTILEGFLSELFQDDIKARGLKEAKEELDILKLDDEERREYEEYLESLRYGASMFESSFKVGEMKGEKRGLEKGARDKAIEMAKKLKERGIDIDLISETSGLSKDEIESL